MCGLGWQRCDLPPSVGCFGPGGSGGEVEGGVTKVMELPGPSPRQAVWIKIREVSFGP